VADNIGISLEQYRSIPKLLRVFPRGGLGDWVKPDRAIFPPAPFAVEVIGCHRTQVEKLVTHVVCHVVTENHELSGMYCNFCVLGRSEHLCKLYQPCDSDGLGVGLSIYRSRSAAESVDISVGTTKDYYAAGYVGLKAGGGVEDEEE
jgi:hypothetical protein